MRIIFLGTSAAVPTVDRSLSSIAVDMGREYILIDAGEGVQKQIMLTGLGFGKLSRIIITHLHGDHYFGIFPLLQTMSILRRSSPLDIIAPAGFSSIYKALKEITPTLTSYEVRITEVNGENEFRLLNCTLKMFPVCHGNTPTYGISIKEDDKPGRFDPEKSDKLGVPVELRGVLQKGIPIKLPDGKVIRPEDVMGPPRKGAKVVFSSDTRPCDSLLKEAENADVLIHEATYDDDKKDRAEKTGHSTISEAIEVGIASKARKIVLTHFSARYKKEDLEKMETKIREKYENVIFARDLMVIDL
ncbi:ribonuclease Z [Candidatus Methanodesulfokora washburnensis]|jgi:ribonuclease Z|uniref:Ribonuclease Z n=1 Tax=Candidatus Methanodesulfokora washburnensis TaxID=2478471 RepID=A0A429GLL9_9CREN|nr:ribonuclease Z [Candidatus Methanodesulfokores washburnensis]RSN74728.1 ribonuclease Z [Candidatus Methanodesulfokores washburnensis]